MPADAHQKLIVCAYSDGFSRSKRSSASRIVFALSSSSAGEVIRIGEVRKLVVGGANGLARLVRGRPHLQLDRPDVALRVIAEIGAVTSPESTSRRWNREFGCRRMNEKTSAAYVAISSLPTDGPCQPTE